MLQGIIRCGSDKFVIDQGSVGKDRMQVLKGQTPGLEGTTHQTTPFMRFMSFMVTAFCLTWIPGSSPGMAAGMGRGAKGKGQRAKGKGQRAKGKGQKNAAP